MRLFSGKITPIASDVVKTLLAAKVIETESPREVEADVAAVLNSYLRSEQEVNDAAKDYMQRNNAPQSEFTRMKRLFSDQKGIKSGDETLDYLLDQVVEMFEHSANVDEIFVENVELRRKMAPIFKRHMGQDDALDAEVRAQLRHVKEGTRDWDVEYGRMVEIVKRKKGLS